jgi:L-fuconolactonase
MAQSIQPGRFGHIGRPDDAWLAKQETELILEPELPIIDTHHHLWDRNGWTYLLPELLADLNTGHNIVGTGYATLRNAFKRIAAGCSSTEKLALYCGTAKRLYGLD